MGYLTEPLTLVFHFIFFTLYQHVFIIEYESTVKKIKSEILSQGFIPIVSTFQSLTDHGS